MNPIAEEILMHYGMPRRSGRYPWGSGEDPYQHNRDFISRVDELKKTGWKPTAENIKKEFGLTTAEYRNEISIAKDQRLMLNIARAKSLKKDGLGPTEIGKIMGKPESTIRGYFDEEMNNRVKASKKTVDFLRDQVNRKKMVDVGTNVELELGVTKTKLDTALYYLETREGYHVWGGRVPQPTNPGQFTTNRVLCAPDIPHSYIFDNWDKVQTLKEYHSSDDGENFDKLVYPKSMDSKRMMIRYKDDVGPDGATGDDKDGLVELRRGVPDLSLGDSHYSQVRILVDDKKYIKGMAVYSDDMPDGIDVVFNTNKPSTVSKMDVLKNIKDDPENPFGSLIKPNGQSYYIDKDGKRQLSLINKRADEGDWSEWKDALPAQFLSKQPIPLARKQLNLAKADKIDEFEDIKALNNPTVKKHLLQKFSDECDSAAVHLKAAALPGQKYHVIIPVNTLKDNEIYAPGYEPGTKLALIRYPHGGLFEIPVLTVKKSDKLAEKMIGKQSMDAVGINKKIADRLSGADYDGDTVMCIPTDDASGKIRISRKDQLKELIGFDPKMEYPARPGMTYMKNPKTGADQTQKQMGMISNLITDMTLAGASDDKLARAVRHSMVVIDAGKHELDYKKSELDNNIAALRDEYQRKILPDGSVKTGGASTIISRSKGEYSVDKRQGTAKINIKGKSWYDPNKPEGSLIYKTADDLYYADKKHDKAKGEYIIRTADGKKITYSDTDAEAKARYNPVKRVDEDTGEVYYTDKTGSIRYRTKTRTQASTQMAETDDAYTLVSPAKHPMELLYADYANSMKALANEARKEMVNTGKIEYSKTAATAYAPEVSSLKSKLNEALKNSIKERSAGRLATVQVEAKKKADPNLSKADIRKESQKAMEKYRKEVGAIKRRDRNINITDREWEAIQAGAISETTLKKILNNTDTAKLRERATPRSSTTVSQAKINRIKAMSASNLTLHEIASIMKLSPSTVSKVLKGE